MNLKSSMGAHTRILRAGFLSWPAKRICEWRSSSVTAYTVQDCGCIALPEELQERTGLYPGASFEFEAAEDGSSVTLTSIQRVPKPDEPPVGASCEPNLRTPSLRI